jgi:hypothetical protein
MFENIEVFNSQTIDFAVLYNNCIVIQNYSKSTNLFEIKSCFFFSHNFIFAQFITIYLGGVWKGKFGFLFSVSTENNINNLSSNGML